MNTGERAGQAGANTTLLWAFSLAWIGMLFFVLRHTSPWGWPSLDMATYYVNVQQPGFIASDPFTLCFGPDNGRIWFGRLTEWPIHLGLDWYRTLYLWMLLNSAALPAAAWLCLSRLVPHPSTASRFTVWLLVLLAIAMPGPVGLLTVGWWSGWGTHFHPSLFAITLLFAGTRLAMLDRWMPALRLGGFALVSLAAVIHPAYAIGGGIFLAIVLLFHPRGWLTGSSLLLAILCGLLFVKSQTGSGNLDASQYFNYFIQLHPEHYLPTRFLSTGRHHWALPVVFIAICLCLVAAALYRLGSRKLGLLPIALLSFYLGALALQYLLVEKHPSVTTLLLISPSRFLAFGYWMLLVSLGTLAGCLATRIRLPERLAGIPVWRPNTGPGRGKHAALTIHASGLAGLAVLAWSGYAGLKPPADNLSDADRDLMHWISRNTLPADVIASGTGYLPVAIPLLTGRGSYSGNGFPFTDGCLKENFIRQVNIFGSPTGPRGRQDSHTYYDSRDISHFMHISPRPDWVVMNRDSKSAQMSRSILAPAHENASYVVFRTLPSAGVSGETVR